MASVRASGRFHDDGLAAGVAILVQPGFYGADVTVARSSGLPAEPTDVSFHAGGPVVLDGNKATIETVPFLCRDPFTGKHFRAHAVVEVVQQAPNGAGGYRLWNDETGEIVSQSDDDSPAGEVYKIIPFEWGGVQIAP